MYIRRVISAGRSYSIPIISVGNLVVGGSGKTPFIISLASNLKVSKIYIISRGYGRRSRGLIEVSRDGEILTDIYSSGDEAMLMAKSLSNVSIVVSESRRGGAKFRNFAQRREEGALRNLLPWVWIGLGFPN